MAQKIQMARAARIIADELDIYAKQVDVQGLLIPAHAYLGDLLILRYHHAPVMNIIRSKIVGIPKHRRQSKHFTFGYWYKIVDTLFSNQEAPRRKDLSGTIYGEMTDYNSYGYVVSQFLIADYSVNDALMINNIVNTFTLKEIIYGCDVARTHGATNIAYVNAVLQNEMAKQNMKNERARILGGMAEKSDELLGKQKQTHSRIEVAQMEYEYNQKQENAMLDALLKRMMEGKKDG